MDQFENLKQFYGKSNEAANEKERQIPELAFMAQHVEDETENIKAQIALQNKQLARDFLEMQREATVAVQDMHNRQDAIENSKILHEKEVDKYEEAARKKAELLRKEKESVNEVLKDGEMVYEKKEGEMSANAATIKKLKEQIASQKAELAEIKRKKSWKRRFRALFCCCMKGK